MHGDSNVPADRDRSVTSEKKGLLHFQEIMPDKENYKINGGPNAESG
jgi:hypothetical protein